MPPAARSDTFLHVAEVARLWTAQGKPNSGEFGYGSDFAAGRIRCLELTLYVTSASTSRVAYLDHQRGKTAGV